MKLNTLSVSKEAKLPATDIVESRRLWPNKSVVWPVVDFAKLPATTQKMNGAVAQRVER